MSFSSSSPAKTNGTPLMHRRAAAGGGTSHPILPVTVHDDEHDNNGGPMLSTNSTASSTQRRKPGVGSNNNFLLGGMYVPGKDKRKRPIHRPHRRYRFRITNQIMDLWWRLWYTSPAVALIGGFGVFYVLLCYLLFPLMGWLLFGSTTSTWSWSHRGIDWLLTDTTLLLVTPQEERAVAEQLALLRKQQHQPSSTRLQRLESLASGWYHRNDPVPLAQHPGLVRHEYEGGSTTTITTLGGAKKEVSTPRTNSRKSSNEQDPKRAPDANKQAQAENHDRPVLRTLYTMEQLAVNHAHCPGNLVDTDLRTTLVVQSSLDRIWVLEETCLRWSDPIVAVVAIRDQEPQREEIRNLTTAWSETCPQLSVIVYPLDPKTEDTPEQYPVNVLRNLGLDEVRTSHVLMVDVDFVPSQNLHETIRSVLIQQQQKQQNANVTLADKQAIVVPAFARVLDPPCSTDVDCGQHLRNNSSFIPHTFDEIQHCFSKKDCIVFQSNDNWPGHASTRSNDWLKKQWYENNDTSVIRRISCFETLRYEPYVVIRWCPRNVDASTTTTSRPLAPYYDERFHGYGKNKIEYIAHLRLLGYQFRVLPEGFIVHNPHVESAVKDTWNNVAESDLHRTMDRLYQTFVGELVDKYYDQYKDEIVQSCPPPEKV